MLSLNVIHRIFSYLTVIHFFPVYFTGPSIVSLTGPDPSLLPLKGKDLLCTDKEAGTSPQSCTNMVPFPDHLQVVGLFRESL